MAELANCSTTSIAKNMKLFNIETLHEVRYRGVTKYKVDKYYFDEMNNGEKIYWYSFLLADGGIETMNCNTFRLCILLQREDENHLNKFKTAIKTEAPIVPGESYIAKTNKYYPNSLLRINCTYLCNSLMKYGMEPNKSAHERVPNFSIEGMEKDCIRGYFDGDGCFTYWYDLKRKQFVCSFNVVGSKEIVSFIHSLLKERFYFRAEVKPDGRLFRFDIGGNTAEQIMQWLYSGNGPYLERKYNDWREWIQIKEMTKDIQSLGISLESLNEKSPFSSSDGKLKLRLILDLLVEIEPDKIITKNIV
jgi:hypothetical protein